MTRAAILPPPLTAADREALARLIATAWPDCARKAGVEPAEKVARVDGTGRLWVQHVRLAGDFPEALRAAIEELARDLEDEGWAVERRDGGVRVVGWATVEVQTHPTTSTTNCELRRVRIADLAPWHPARHAYHERLRLARLAQREPPEPRPKLEHARRVQRMANGRR